MNEFLEVTWLAFLAIVTTLGITFISNMIKFFVEILK